MLYGHVETLEQKAEHLLKLYDLQRETGGFQAFIPLAYHPAGNRLGGGFTTGVEDLRHLAASRVALSNFPHIKAYWVEFGLKLAQVMLLWGADDVDGTVGRERIYHAAGAGAPQGVTIGELAAIIRGAGLKPMVRDALYRDISEYEPAGEDAQKV
jgi:aminodeoxyfutalosine synthase